MTNGAMGFNLIIGLVILFIMDKCIHVFNLFFETQSCVKDCDFYELN